MSKSNSSTERKTLIYKPSAEDARTKQKKHLLKRLLIGRTTLFAKNIDQLFNKPTS